MTELSVKLLLKQAYVAHTTKVKYLEDEVEEFKNKFIEADRKLKEYGSECKRCAELEEAFKSCKAALHAQTKWFENLGEKFSVFSSSESANASKKTHLLADDISVTLNVSNVLPEKSSTMKQNLFKNLMSLNCDETKDSLDLCSAPFPINLVNDYSTLNQDSLILAPDTVDMDVECKLTEKTHKGLDTNAHKQRTTSNKNSDTANYGIDSGNSTNVKEDQDSKRLSKKRQLSKSADVDNTAKKVSIESEILVHKIQVTEPNTKYCKENKPTEPDTFSGGKLKAPSVVKDIDAKQSLAKTTSKNKPSENLKNVLSDSVIEAKNIPALDIEICKDEITVSTDDDSLDAAQKCHRKVAANIKDSSYQVSPSLLPINNKNSKVLPTTHTENEDINDFQTPMVNKKFPENDSTWTACDKKKIKKASNIKLKTTSKFKMSLDSLPPNYKKPTYRQTKLSKSIFQPKPSTSAAVANEKEFPNDESSNKNCIILTPVKNGGKSSGIDFDATCIPDNYAYEIVPSRTGTEKRFTSDTENSNDESILLIGDESLDENLADSPDPSPVLKESNQQRAGKSSNDGKEEAKFEDFLENCKTNKSISSFDRLPKKEEPNYKYKEETVRRKAERMQLNGYDCKECEKYFAELGLSDEEKQERLKKCSRHRSKFAPPPTPEHFWELEFPDTQECKARGYLNETQKGKLKSHRRRPL